MIIVTHLEVLTVFIQLLTTTVRHPTESESTSSIFTTSSTSKTFSTDIAITRSSTSATACSIASSSTKVSSSTGTTSVATHSFDSIMLAAHNNFRSLHNAQQVAWNTTLYDYAYSYASKYDCSGDLVHSGGPYGENLAIGYTPNGSVNAWYDEGQSYNYKTQDTYDHFTQVIWNGTSQIGCAYKYCNEVWGKYIICSYYPPGNIIGESSENVFPLV
ncbi:probable pathogenesis-related protein CaO19.2336 [[Candida] railenensis]|uniref:Probable pathogenesis-related protein CaO19.2336 n=1 Tax=[Candida] railenensis TaxID=45579 RepID=A0A9P0QNX5_9ASCO|nr:probable pathogenesis-related protein CaO19.2336 [[Candida] railenensis]